MEHLLEIKDLKVEFPSKAGNIHAVNGGMLTKEKSLALWENQDVGRA